MNTDKGQSIVNRTDSRDSSRAESDFVLDKDIFSNVFEKDIRRVFIYKKAERLAKAIHLITPAFPSPSMLRDRIDTVAVGLIDAAILPSAQARVALARELLALSSVLSVARTGGLLSSMNVDLISHEAHVLLGEIASYEEPRISFEPMDTLAELAKQFNRVDSVPREVRKASPISKGHITDIAQSDMRQSAILDIVRSKGTVYIKDISMVIRDVSEKTIQRALSKLVGEGVLEKRGERRWTAYSLAK